MPQPQIFYTIPKEAYLFGKQRRSAPHQQELLNEDLSPGEESVRQWAIFELLSTFGVRIDRIAIEAPVRVGSKTYRIDILIRNDNKEAKVVVECKKPGGEGSASGLEQAISYADNENIRAEWVVYTNGTVWKVRRRIEGRWCDADELPRQIDTLPNIDLATVIQSVGELIPILKSLGGIVQSSEAKAYLYAWQRFFYSTNLFTVINSRSLVYAADNLLRVASGVTHQDGYLYDKTSAACKWIRSFGREFYADEGIGISSLFELVNNCEVDIRTFHLSSEDITLPDVLLLRFICQTCSYIKDGLRMKPRFFRGREYPAIPMQFQQCGYEYLSSVVKLTQGWELPASLGDDDWGEILLIMKIEKK